jgi:hypothetical protein
MREFLGKPVNVVIRDTNLPPVRLVDIEEGTNCCVFEVILPEGQTIPEGEELTRFSVPMTSIVFITNGHVEKRMQVPAGMIPPGAKGLILPGNGKRG